MGDDGALVPLQSLQSDLGDLRLRLAQKHLARCGQHVLVLALDLHLAREGSMSGETGALRGSSTEHSRLAGKAN